VKRKGKPPTFEEFVAAVRTMRAAQDAFFKAKRAQRDQPGGDQEHADSFVTLLIAAKTAEVTVDDMLAQLGAPGIQPSLFDTIEGEEATDGREDR